MVNQVHVVGEGLIGRALISGEYQWISGDIPFSLSQISDADNLGLCQGYTWWQHQFLSGIKTIAVVPMPAFGVAQFGSMQKVSESLEFLDQVKGATFLMESLSWPPSSKDAQKDAFMYNPQFQLDSPSTTEGLVRIKAGPENSRLENTISVDSLKNFAITSTNHSLHCFNGYTSNKSFSGLNPHIVAMPVNSKSISTLKVFQSDSNLRHNNIPGSAQQFKSAKQPGSSWASGATSFSNFTNLQRIEHGLSCTPNKLRYCLQSEKSSSFLDSHSSIVSTDAEQKSTLFDNDAPFVQSDVIQEVGPAGSTRACELHELPNEIWGETTTGAMKPVIKGVNKNNGFLESTAFDPVMNGWDDTALLAGNTSHLSATAMNSVSGQASSDPLSVEERGLFSESFFEELLGFDCNVGPVMDSTEPLAGFVSGCHLPRYNLQDSFSVCKAQVPPLILPSSSCTSENVPIGSSKETPMSLQNLSMDDCGSLNTANSKVSQVKKPEGEKVVKKRARPGESTRPRPKDRQQIQERVKELREIVPNSAKCSIDALLDRTIKHMLFLQSVTKYAEKIKQADEPKMISKDSCAVLNDNSNGVVLKDDPSGGCNGGATWAYEVAGQTMVCPIIVEDLAPPGQMLVEQMLCEERGFFLEIADTIRGFGLTILKGLMELRDGKIMARFLVEANKNVTRMDIFLSLVQLLQQNSLNRSSDQLTKVMNNGIPSFAEHQQPPVSIPVGLAGR
ncbi:transcription factor LHW-like isoform X3 [Miscanthus floridulus]